MEGNHQEVKQKVLEYACHISRVKYGSKKAITPDRPEYRILKDVITNEMAEVGLCLKLEEPQSAAELAAKCGKSVEETEKLAFELAIAGAAIVNEIDGVNQYWNTIWVPGHMEIMVNHAENVKKFPEIAECFDTYGKLRGPVGAGMFPVGVGPMRVIPIERSLDGETKHISSEEVSTYLEEHEVFTVSDCSCRTSREVMGEGCGHLKEDMCIQMGFAAEYYIKTGRGRQITREEAYEIIKKAEDNGLMHSIPNLDGEGKTHAICNCCGCGCFAMRLADMWTNPDMVRSNFVSKVDAEKCVACGECVEGCPTNAARLGQKLCTIEPVEMKSRVLKPYETHGENTLNEDYRINKQVVVEGGTSPCKAECPAHIGIQGYIKLASQGKYQEALELIKEENPFPAVCGRICPRNCESECTRADIDEAIAIDDIKKFIASKDLDADNRFIPRIKHSYGNKIAVIGAGPAGLTCAYFLAVDGYDVTVYEKQEKLGGMLTLGIPEFRLEKEVIESEIAVLREIGVKFVTGCEVGKDITIPELRKQGVEAFFLAIGAQAGRNLNIEGEDAEGVYTGVDFLREVNLGNFDQLEGKTVVIGGGNVAIDVARTAVRIGSTSVDLVCLESFENMPALEEEVEEALAEDIIINNSWGPKRILVEDGKVVGLELVECVSVLDENGRFNPEFNTDNTRVIECSNVLVSVGQGIDWGTMLEGTEVELNKNNTVKADAITFQTNDKDIFAGGDALTGPKFAIDAIAVGKEGAISIHRYVQPGQDLLIGRINRDYRPLDKENLDLNGYDTMPRMKTPHVDGQEWKTTFSDLRETLTEEQMRAETERCIGCGATYVDEFMCVGCGQCVLKCKFDAIKLERVYDAKNVTVHELKGEVVKHVLKQKAKVTVNKVKHAIFGERS